MVGRAEFEALRERGEGRAADAAVAALYAEAFREFGVSALWNRRPGAQPSYGQALVIAEALRREGDLRARALAEKIEDACRAAL